MHVPEHLKRAAELAELAQEQGGAVARRQLRALGIPREVVRQELRGRRWRRPLPGTCVLFSGPLPPETRIWAALLYAGDGAVASHRTAAWLDGLISAPPKQIDVVVAHGHRHRGSRPGVRVRQSRHAGARRHPAKSPPRTRIEDTVLDLADEQQVADAVITQVLAACQRRLTTAARLSARLRQRRRARWRRLLEDLLAEVRAGVASELERRHRRDVEVAHGLPRGRRNLAETAHGRRRYRDVRYPRMRLVVELDGRAAHPDEWQEYDDLRDNELVADEDTSTLRYGWLSVAGRPCATAAQLAKVMQARGWTGELKRCGPGCTAA